MTFFEINYFSSHVSNYYGYIITKKSHERFHSPFNCLVIFWYEVCQITKIFHKSSLKIADIIEWLFLTYLLTCQKIYLQTLKKCRNNFVCCFSHPSWNCVRAEIKPNNEDVWWQRLIWIFVYHYKSYLGLLLHTMIVPIYGTT